MFWHRKSMSNERALYTAQSRWGARGWVYESVRLHSFLCRVRRWYIVGMTETVTEPQGMVNLRHVLGEGSTWERAFRDADRRIHKMQTTS